MGNALNTQMSHGDMATLVGGDILNLITCGMYVSPLVIYREYLQNAADSIAASGLENGKVEIATDLEKMCVTIRDNGPGLSYEQATRDLVPISRSCKNRQQHSGFRGIGRLSGLAFGSSVTFLTRCGARAPVTKVIWDRDRLKNGISNKLPAEEIILQCAIVEKVNGDNYPDHFFEVRVEGIARYAATLILNRDAVRKYLGEVCPVPFGVDFPYSQEVSNLFRKTQLLALDVRLDREEVPITRLHKGGADLSRDRMDRFVGFEKIEIPALGDEECAAVGWIAHSSYLGALPEKLGVRCLRVRVGNIQVGSESAFDHLFSENRFNRWCVAEIHILDPHIVPNGRCDYFEPSVHLRNFENHLGAICRKLERQCRVASRGRKQRQHFHFFLENLEATHDLANSGYLTTKVARQFIDGKLTEIADFREKYEAHDCIEEAKKLDKLEKMLAKFRTIRGQSSLKGVHPSALFVYRKIFKILAETSPSPRTAKETIETILRYKQE